MTTIFSKYLQFLLRLRLNRPTIQKQGLQVHKALIRAYAGKTTVLVSSQYILLPPFQNDLRTSKYGHGHLITCCSEFYVTSIFLIQNSWFPGHRMLKTELTQMTFFYPNREAILVADDFKTSNRLLLDGIPVTSGTLEQSLSSVLCPSSVRNLQAVVFEIET